MGLLEAQRRLVLASDYDYSVQVPYLFFGHSGRHLGDLPEGREGSGKGCSADFGLICPSRLFFGCPGHCGYSNLNRLKNRSYPCFL